MREAFNAAETALDLSRAVFEGDDALAGCPCFTIDMPEFYADGSCWRVGCDDHPYDARRDDGRCCVHVYGPDDMAERLRALLDAMNWYGGWALEKLEERPK
jgi:hypothetical protein